MATQGSSPSTDIARIIERQMRNWELARSQRTTPETPAQPAVHPFVAISRMVGAGGRRLADALSEQLGWPVFDREILQAMAGDDALRQRVFEFLDERDVGWVEDTLRWLVEEGVHTSQYSHRLSETILALARKGPAVFLGRGAHLILPHDRGLRVHLVADVEVCAQNLAERRRIGLEQARADIERIQRERTEFLRRQFGRNAESATQYDLVINTGQFERGVVADVVLHALRSRETIQ